MSQNDQRPWQRTQRILLCDDAPDLAYLLENWLESYPRYELAASARALPEALGLARQHRPDIVLVDTMGEAGRPDLPLALRAIAPRAKLVLYTGYALEQLPSTYVQLADAYVQKSADEKTLIAALDALEG